MKERAGIQSVEVGFTLLDVLARGEGPLMLRDLAAAAGMSAAKALAHWLAHTANPAAAYLGFYGGLAVVDIGLYQWLKRTLETSKAKHKFVFAHHVLGSGRGGVDAADLYEWGGQGKKGEGTFKEKRPGWGARPWADGLDGNSHMFANMASHSIEVTEAEHPMQLLAYEFVPDRAGAGKYRGGVPFRRDYRFLEEEGMLQVRSDRRDHRPFGPGRAHAVSVSSVRLPLV